MPGLMLIFIQGTTKISIEKNIDILNNTMKNQDLFTNISNMNYDKPQIYYCDLPAVPPRKLEDLVHSLKNNRDLNHVVKRILVTTNFLTI